MKLFYLYLSTILILVAPLSFAQNSVTIDLLNATIDDAPDNVNNLKTVFASENKKSDEFTFKVVLISNGTEKIYSEQKVSKISELNISLENGTYKFYVSRQNDTSLVEYNNNSNGYTIVSNSVIILSYPQTSGYILDIPWRIEKSEEYIPILAISKDWLLPEIYNISVYDALNNDTLIETTNWTEKHVLSFGTIPYFYLFNISKTKFLKNEHNRISVKVKFGLKYTDLVYVEIWKGAVNLSISDEDFPKVNNWFYGDTHVHSEYTDNPAEYGAPIHATSEALSAIGLDWMTITDHSFDQTNLSTKWNDYLRDCDIDKRCLRAEEVSCDWGFLGGYSHYLSYNITTFISGPEIYWGDTDTCETIINKVNIEEFGYVAHPEHEDGLRWKWKNYSLPFTGLEVWNSIGPSWEVERDAAILKWTEQLRLGRKIFISAGSDAHGDFNSAFGKVRTACFAKNFTKDNIFSALKNGNCMMTDGPIITFTANRHIIGESFNVLQGDAITLNISWNSTREFGNVTEIFLIRGEIGGNETNESFAPDSLSGTITLASVPNSTYYRIEARSTGPDGAVRRAYTNPIWAFAEPRPKILKIPMDGTERSIIMAFENKYDYSLSDIFIDGWQSGACNADELRANLNMNSSWSLLDCEKQILNERLMWAAFGNAGTGEKKILLQIGRLLLFANATQNEFIVNYTGRPYAPGYINYNWVADKAGREIFEINKLYSMDLRYDSWGSMDYFGTYLIHGFTQHEGNTTAYYSHWGPEQIPGYNIHNIYIRFDDSVPYPLEYEGFVHNTNTKFTRGVFQNRTFNYNATAFGMGADGEFRCSWDMMCDGPAFDQKNRSIFPVIQGGAIANCYADIDCNDKDLSTKDICLSPGTAGSECIYMPQETREIRPLYTEMDADEISKAIDFKNKHGKPLGELYFDGWENYSCSSAGILDALKLNSNWSVIQCQKFSINSSLAMFAGLNNTATGKQYAAYQIGSLLVDDDAAYKVETENFQTPYYPYYYRHLLNRWIAFHNKTQRFEIDVFWPMNCNYGYSWCNDPLHYATYILHGFEIDGNRDTTAFYSFRGSYATSSELISFINILFDNYKGFYFENETSGGSYGKYALYQAKSFGYHAAHGWAFGTKDSFNYRANNMSLFSPYRAEDMLVELGSPAHIFVNDSEGRITGYFNSTYVAEIPGSEIINRTHEKYRIPSGNNYKIRVMGHEDGNYSLKITLPSGGSGGTFYFRNISASAGTQDTFSLNATGSVSASTKDPEKMISLEVENTDDPPASLNFTIARNKSSGISVSGWSNMSSGSISITESVIRPPEIKIISPQNRTYNKSAVFLNATFGESFDSAWISIDGKEAQNLTTGLLEIGFYLEPLPDGTHKVTVFANSSAGETNSSTEYFSINTTTPAGNENGRGGNNGGGGGSGGGGGNSDKDKKKKEKEKDTNKDEKDREKSKDNKQPKNESAHENDGRDEKDLKRNITFKEDEKARDKDFRNKITGRITSNTTPLFSKLFAWLRSVFSVFF